MDNKQLVGKKGNKIIYIALVGVLLLVLALVVSIGTSQNKVVAKVGSKTISEEELYEFLVEKYGETSLDTLISNEIIKQEAEKEKVTVSKEEKEKELQTLIDSYGGEEAFSQTLEENGMTSEEMSKEIQHYLTIKKLLEPRIAITEDEMKTYFEENKETFNQEEQVKASHILVADESTAREVKDKLSAGKDFAELAKEYSTDTASAENGGDLGFFGKGVMAAEFEEVAFSIEKDTISAPVKSEYGYHIIRVIDKKAAKEAVYEEHVEEIKSTLFDQYVQSEYTTWLDEKKENYKIENELNKG
jgi:foldase protein PrsA